MQCGTAYCVLTEVCNVVLHTVSSLEVYIVVTMYHTLTEGMQCDYCILYHHWGCAAWYGIATVYHYEGEHS